MDTFKSQSPALESPARDGAALSRSNSADLPVMTRALYIGVGGNLSVEMAGGQTVTFTNVPSGTILPVRIIKLRASGTTADEVIGLW